MSMLRLVCSPSLLDAALDTRLQIAITVPTVGVLNRFVA